MDIQAQNILEQSESSPLLPDFSSIDEVRRAFVASEIINRKF